MIGVKGTGTGYFNEKPDFGKQNFKEDEANRRPKFQVNSKSKRGQGYDFIFDENDENNMGNRRIKYEEVKKYSKSDSNRDENPRDYSRRDVHQKRSPDRSRDKSDDRNYKKKDSKSRYKELSPEKRHYKSDGRRSRECDEKNRHDKDRRHRKDNERSEERHKHHSRR